MSLVSLGVRHASICANYDHYTSQERLITVLKDYILLKFVDEHLRS